MKYVKMLGLAAVAAMALMAFLGASSASATVLCTKAETSNCSTNGNDFTGLLSSSLAGTAKLSTTGGTLLDTCTVGRVKGTPSTGGSTETVKGAITELFWGPVGEGCTKTTDTLAPGELEIHWISGTDNGTVTGSGASVTVNTIFGSCFYGTGENKDLGELKGGSPATIAINTNVPKTGGGGTCPAETHWEAEYTVTEPSALYVATN